MRAFVTGGNGFLGSHLVETLVKRGYEVTCLVRKTSDLTWLKDLKIKYVYGDMGLGDQGLAEGLRNADIVFNLAGKVMALSRDEYFQVNSLAPEILAQTAVKVNPKLKRIVFTSSLAVQGPGVGREPTDELWGGKPVTWYGESKLEMEKRVLPFKNQIPITIVRPGPIYGPRDYAFLDVFKTMKNGFRIDIYGKSKILNMAYVQDIVDGIILAGEKDVASGEIFLLGDSKNYDWDEVMAILGRTLGKKGLKIPIPVPIVYLVAGISELIAKIRRKPVMLNLQKVPELIQTNWAFSVAKAQKLLGYEPKVDLAQGFELTLEWYQKTKRL
ncbi:MAG: NAD-dependent epimerase/dehydratase family protein [bacterium]|nr:NAD-dependent epimerase/dehydratase family protein [bacterium]